uniref:C2 calcium/lipid-binding domain, CaLB n=1 Tax=Tanacetum cinerariifolium TaxID=118510 RepID=A0A699I135_TANCI|nr:C2 calcium/lipid-binding domain, CaLB [Tanacetum cinerariifolium]
MPYDKQGISHQPKIVESLVITEYLVKISKRRAFWSLNEDILKITDLTTYTPYPSRKIRRIRACTHQRPQRKPVQYVVIKGEFEKLEDLKVEDVSLTCDTSLEVFNNEFNRIRGMYNDLFTYEVEIAKIPCNSNKNDASEQRMSHKADDDMGYDPSDIAFTEWFGSKNFNYKTMDHYTKKALWIYWIRGDDEVELTKEEFSDNEDEVAEVFRIDTNIFDF